MCGWFITPVYNTTVVLNVTFAPTASYCYAGRICGLRNATPLVPRLKSASQTQLSPASSHQLLRADGTGDCAAALLAVLTTGAAPGGAAKAAGVQHALMTYNTRFDQCSWHQVALGHVRGMHAFPSS
jgi:hypothetical protein